jgi:hypothetical protein
MARKTIPDMKEVFRQAAEIAQQVPENMQVTAFNRALDLLTGTTEQQEERKNASQGATSSKPQVRDVQANTKNESPVATLMSELDTTQHPAVAATTKVLDRALLVLQIALRHHNIDGLTPPEIAQILTTKFRLNTSRQAVSMAISSVTTLVNRVPRGSGYEYRIMGPGEEYLTHLGSEQSALKHSGPVKINRKKRAAKSSARVVESKVDLKAAGTKSSRPGPKQILETLIRDKFFDSPRDIAQMIEHIRHRYARTYKATDLSPALTRLRREDKLDRTKNGRSVYEYVVRR